MTPPFIDNRCENVRVDDERGEVPVNKDALVVGLALFAMFFGAGNLIFPPYLGMESGELWPLGLACFVFFDVVVSCVGVFAINNAGGSILSIQNALGKKAGLALNTAAILCVGMLIARAALRRHHLRDGHRALVRRCHRVASRSPSRFSPWCFY